MFTENNAIINLKGNCGDNALNFAVKGKKYDVCKLLLKHGADVNNICNNGKSILEIVNNTGDHNIIALMKEHLNAKKANKELEQASKPELSEILG